MYLDLSTMSLFLFLILSLSKYNSLLSVPPTDPFLDISSSVRPLSALSTTTSERRFKVSGTLTFESSKYDGRPVKEEETPRSHTKEALTNLLRSDIVPSVRNEFQMSMITISVEFL